MEYPIDDAFATTGIASAFKLGQGFFPKDPKDVSGHNLSMQLYLNKNTLEK